MRHFTRELIREQTGTSNQPIWLAVHNQAQNTGSPDNGPECVMRRIALSLATLLMGFIIVWLALLAMNISVRLDVLRDPIEAAASRALGRQVRVLGQIEARPTLGPTIVVHDVRISDPGGRKGSDLLLANRVEARLGLIDWLRGKPYITRLMILCNIASLLDVRHRELTDWFWVAYTDAYDWVVEPNVLGMGTYSLGDIMTTNFFHHGQRIKSFLLLV